MFDKAVSLHKKGQIDEAEYLYRKVLARNPKNPEALHLLGVVEAQRKNFAAAVEMFDRAIKIQPTNAAFLSNRGNALKGLKRLDEALYAYDKALAIKPDYAEALNNRGVVLQGLMRPGEALDSLNRALTIKPDYAEAFSNRGNVFQELGRLDEALASYDCALVIKPDYAEAHCNRGNTLQKLRRLDEALASCYHALTIRPQFAEAHNIRGNVLKELRRFGEALSAYHRALAIKPDYAEALFNRGHTLHELKRLHEAIASFDRALSLKPGDAEILNARGNTLEELKRFGEALANYDLAIAIKPDYADALFNRGHTLHELKRLDEAEVSYGHALSLKPDDAETLNARGLTRLLNGQFKDGWADYEWRWQTRDLSGRGPKYQAPVWRGEQIAGRSILVIAEQGIGDLIQFARFLPLLVRLGAKLTLGVPPEIVRLLRPLGAHIEFVTSVEDRKTYDFQCALMSLPLWFGTDLNSIPKDIPYLKPEAELVARWKARIGDHGFKVGIAWQGNPAGKIDQGRSYPLSEIVPIARLADVRLISLQKYHGVHQLVDLPADVIVETLGDDFDSGKDALIDTAAVMSHLDLIITADTSIAHLAGALGCRTWVALKYVPDWRWLLDRNDSPWYPSLRLFRQETDGDWQRLFSLMKSELCRSLAMR